MFYVYTTLHRYRNLCLKRSGNLWNSSIVQSVWVLGIPNATLSSLHHFVLRVSLQVHRCVLFCQSLCCFLSLLLFDCSSFRINRFYVPRLIFVVGKIVLCYGTLNAWNIYWSLCTVYLVSLITRGLHNTCKFVSRHRVFCWCYYGFASWFLLTYNYVCVLSGVASATDWRCLFWSSLLLTFLTVLVASLFLFCWNCGLLSGALDCLLHSWWVFGAALLSVGVGTVDFIVEAKNVSHTFF